MPYHGMAETQVTAAASTLQNLFTAGNKGGHHLIPNMAVIRECQGRVHLPSAPHLVLFIPQLWLRIEISMLIWSCE